MGLAYDRYSLHMMQLVQEICVMGSNNVDKRLSTQTQSNLNLQYVNNSEKVLNCYFVNISIDPLYVIQQQ